MLEFLLLPPVEYVQRLAAANSATFTRPVVPYTPPQHHTSAPSSPLNPIPAPMSVDSQMPPIQRPNSAPSMPIPAPPPPVPIAAEPTQHISPSDNDACTQDIARQIAEEEKTPATWGWPSALKTEDHSALIGARAKRSASTATGTKMISSPYPMGRPKELDRKRRANSLVIPKQACNLVTCRPTDTFLTVLEKFFSDESHWIRRIYVVDDSERPIGVVTFTNTIKILLQCK